MRAILIVGAGQAGLQLALGLQQHDYDVTVTSPRTPDEIRQGRVTSSQCMFHTAVRHEREPLQLDQWEHEAPQMTHGAVTMGVPGSDIPAIDWIGTLDGPAQSIDQRVKMATWLTLFADRGGTVLHRQVTTSDLDRLIRHYDLVLVAAGNGELSRIFARNSARSPYTTPQRALAVSYVHGAESLLDSPGMTAVRFSAVPGVGELFTIPGHTLSGTCNIPTMIGVPGGPLDCWQDDPEPAEHWERMLELLRQFFPWEYPRFKDAELTDAKGTLSGALVPVVRDPVGELPSGRVVLGMADTLVLNDPLAGQGANNASKCAASYLSSIVEHGDGAFDRLWMDATFERWWTSSAKDSTEWSNTMLRPLPQHMVDVLAAAASDADLRNWFVNGFDDPKRLLGPPPAPA